METVPDNVPPVKSRPVPTVTLLKPPEPLPYRILVPDVAGALEKLDVRSSSEGAAGVWPGT